MSRRRFRHAATAAAVYGAVALYATWPLARLGADHLLAHFSPEDLILHVWGLAWDVHALATHPLDLFQANIMHPARNTLALSEHLLGQLPIFAPVRVLTDNPILAFNANVFVTFVLCGLFTHLLVAAWTGRQIAAYAAGLAFAFAPWRLESFHWAQLLSTQYFPAVLYALDRAAITRRAIWVIAAAAALTLQALCGYYLAFLAFAMAGSYAVADCAVRGVRHRWRACAGIGAALLVPAAILRFLSRPYVELGKAGVLAAPQESFGVIMAAFGSPGRILRLYAGWGATALAALSIVAFARAARHVDRDELTRLTALALTLVVGLGCAAGPNGLLAGWFAPYAWLAATVPGFAAIRLPARFGFVCSFALSVLGGLGVAATLARFSGGPRPWRAPLEIAAASAAFALALLPLASERPLRAFAIPVGDEIPAVYRWLARNGGGAPLLELPVTGALPAPGTKPGRAEAMAMYFSTVHWLPILNGYSGYFPPSYTTLMTRAARLPDPEALRFLVDCTSLRWILVHARRSDDRNWQTARGVEARGSFPSATGTDRLYEVTLHPSGACPVDLSIASSAGRGAP
jgi:hypothetical protein